ncbi:hypothetical protein Vafri_5381 [Volvox africanus]|nr:hypothetical protein Vafri_5381 [Volvox africanus]
MLRSMRMGQRPSNCRSWSAVTILWNFRGCPKIPMRTTKSLSKSFLCRGEINVTSTNPYSSPALYTSDDAFSLSSYWDERYLREGGAPFEWYRDYNSLEPILSRHLDKSRPVLHVGVGTSRVQFQMHHDGYREIVNVDYAPVCIQQLSELHAGLPGLSYEVADCRNMPQYIDASFGGGVLDKGTLDALLCGDNDEVDADAMLQECHRVLPDGSSYIGITYAPPRTRLRYLLRPQLEWEVSFYEVGQQGWREGPVTVKGVAQEVLEAYPKQKYSHFVYVCTRKSANISVF